MSIYYTIYAEAKIQGKWCNFNPYIKAPNGEMHLIPIYGWVQSSFREAYDEMTSDCWCGVPDDICEELVKELRLDEMIDCYKYGEKTEKKPRRLANAGYYKYLNFNDVHRRIVPGMQHQHQGYVRKTTLDAYKIGEVQEIYDWLDLRQYSDLTEKQKRKYSYYEWGEDDSWYEGYRAVANKVYAMMYWYDQNIYKMFDYNNREGTEIDCSDIRLIIEFS